MRLRAVTDSGCELFHRDFSVGTIQLQIRDEWNGMTNLSMPLVNPANAVTAVAPGDHVYLRASGIPTALEQSFGWQVGTNASIKGAYLDLTSEEAGELEVNLTIDDPQFPFLPFKIGFPGLDGIEG